jgi:hypothetical protein
VLLNSLPVGVLVLFWIDFSQAGLDSLGLWRTH